MSTAIAVLDRSGRRFNARTDVLVVVNGDARSVTWVPRDLYCATIGDRINEAYRLGGAGLLAACLAEHGFVVRHVACVSRPGAARWLEAVGTVTVPVDRPLTYRYPLAPELPIEDGAKEVAFSPPAETLRGERVHQWIGARYGPAAFTPLGGDLDRCRRQQIFLRAVLDRPLPPLRRGEWRGRFGEEVRRVRSDWRLATLDGVTATRVRGKSVLRRATEGSRRWPAWRRWALRLAKWAGLGASLPVRGRQYAV